MDGERLTFLFGDAASEAIDEYDLDDESGRMEAVERFLPLPAGVGQRGASMAVRTIAVSQILQDDPPEAWATAQRLRDSGLDVDRVLSQISMVISEHLMSALSTRATFDGAAYVGALAALPLPAADEVETTLIRIAREQPGITAEDHVEATIAALGREPGQVVESLVERVLEHLTGGPIHLLPGDVTIVVPDVVAGATFTHRISDAELELGVVSAGFDLGAFARLDVLRLADGDELDQFSVEFGHVGWRGPDGWLDGFSAGELLSFRVSDVDVGDGNSLRLMEATVTLASLDQEPVLVDDAVDAVRAAYDELVAEPGLPVTGDEIALWLCFHHPELVADVQVPLAALCAAAGLEQRGGLVAHDEAVWRRDVFRRRFAEACDLVPEPEWQRVLAHALDVLDDPDASADEVRSVLDECCEPETIDALADVLFPHHLEPADANDEMVAADSPRRLFDLVDRATAVARRPREVATAEYLACVLHERSGEPEVAETHLQRANDATPGLGAVAERMGWYRFDRGDARGAMRWWRSLNGPHPAADTIAGFVSPTAGGRKLGRNDPCWCGSGRKFKQCHQNATELPALPDRVGWLCRKATLWLEHTAGDLRAIVTELATARATGRPDTDPWDLERFDEDELEELFTDAFADPIVFDVALHEGGLFALFLHERGALLPDDEQLLAASWRLVDRSVHEVTAVEPGEGMALRDLATGDEREVRERTASRQLRVGDRFCARVVPDGATHQIIGGTFPVRAGEEEAVLDLCAEGDGVEVCAWAGALTQPPRLVHQAGLAESMFDGEALSAAIADLDEDADDETLDARLRDELTRQAHARWLDEHVPALGGLTPREAADDPTRREQLERLLDEFEEQGRRLAQHPDDAPGGFVPFTYDVPALRRELGLA